MFESNKPWDYGENLGLIGEFIFVHLIEMGIKVVCPSDVYNELYGRMLIVPHKSWLCSGFTGMSIPPFIVLDYEDVVFALVVKGVEDQFLASAYDARGILPPTEKIIHYKPNELSGAMCGKTVIGALSLKLNGVTCKNCLAELTVSLAAASNTIN